MKRMTISLPNELAATIAQERRRRDTSASDVVRTALETLLVKPQHQAFSGMIGLFDAPENNLADRFEKILDADWADWIWRDSGFGDHDSPYRDRL